MANANGRLPATWNIEADVVIVGYGYAGGVAAIEAVDAGRSAVILEKMPTPGGISITSGGGVRVTSNAEAAFAYLQLTCGGLTPDSVLQAFARGMAEIPAYMAELAATSETEVVSLARTGNYPFPGFEDMAFCAYGQIPNFDQFSYYPNARGLRGGARHFKVIEDNVKARAVPVHFRTVAERLITDPEGRVIGLAASQNGSQFFVKARRAVILACGGFEADEGMKGQFLQTAPIQTTAFRGNTGDGIRMAQALGAPLWHMPNVHGSYGFRHPDPNYPFAIRLARLPDWVPTQPMPEKSEMAWIVVDQSGRRYMNEYAPYMHDTGHRPMAYFDEATQKFPRIPSYMLLDQDGMAMYPLGIPSFNDPEVFFEWSADNGRETDMGILSRVDSLEDAALAMGVMPDVLLETVDRWNQACASRRDDHGRPPESMVPVRRPPYYVGALWPLVSNTQGGPVHNENWQILDAFGEPIPGLYEAGELGGIFGHLYLAGGNLAECYIGGWSAARHAAASIAWSR